MVGGKGGKGKYDRKDQGGKRKRHPTPPSEDFGISDFSEEQFSFKGEEYLPPVLLSSSSKGLDDLMQLSAEEDSSEDDSLEDSEEEDSGGEDGSGYDGDDEGGSGSDKGDDGSDDSGYDGGDEGSNSKGGSGNVGGKEPLM
eukprot:XP_020400158.1 RNA-binding protein cabeza-like [Zea mays]